MSFRLLAITTQASLLCALAFSLVSPQCAQGAAPVAKPKVDVGTLEKKASATPESAEAQLALGQAYAAVKNYDKARLHLRLALRLSKGSAAGNKANLALLALPKKVIAPKTGAQTRMIASMLGLGRTRGTEAKPTVIDFYATWCQPCKQLSGAMDKARSTYDGKVAFVHVNVDDPNSQTIMDQYDVSPIPTVIFLNPDGEVVSYAVGFSGDGSVNDGIKKILPN